LGSASVRPPPLRLTRLTLFDFRNFAHVAWHVPGRLTVIYGPNGSGKTNLLEAISLLTPGRGLRGARFADLARVGPGASGRWAVAGRFLTPAGEIEIGTGSAPEGAAEKRVFRLNGASVRSQLQIAEHVSAAWLTPQMDRLFQEGAASRRRFLDRLVLAFDPAHAREIAAHETAATERLRLLAQGDAHPSWLAGIEEAMARHAVAVTHARLSLIARLNAVLAAGLAGFPTARLSLRCAIAEHLCAEPALATENWLRAELAALRARDAAHGTTALGAHRADLLMTDADTGLLASLLSTGQQKALLVAVVLAHALALTEIRGHAPILLLDEALTHLDAARRSALFTALMNLPTQVLLTGVDRETFLPLRAVAQGLRITAGSIEEDADFACLYHGSERAT